MEKNKVFIIAPDFYGIDRSISHAFELSGFKVYLNNSRTRLSKTEVALFKLIKEFPFARAVFNQGLKLFLNEENSRYLNEIKKFKPNIILVIKGETVFPETLKKIKKTLGIPCMSYIWDSPFFTYTGKTADIYRKNNFAEGMDLYEHIFIYDPYYVEELKKSGLRELSYLPLATDTDQYRKVTLNENENNEYDFDISFVGSPFPARIEIFEKLRDFKLGVFGDGWREMYKNKNLPAYYKGNATGEKVLKIYSGSKIVLNIHDPEAKHSVNTRTFDIPASGAFELTDYKPEIEKLFNIGEEMVCYKDIPDLLKLAGYYLNNPSERQRIAENGKKRIFGGHTWRHRVKEMIETAQRKGLLSRSNMSI